MTNELQLNGLIWVSAHVQKCTASWIRQQVRHVLIFSKCCGIYLYGNKQVVGKLIFALIYSLYVDNTGIFTTESFVVLVQK